MLPSPSTSEPAATTQPSLPAVGPKLVKLLGTILVLFALISADSLYLISITFMEWRTGQTYQNYFYLTMFLLHLALGIALVLPVLVFALCHMAKARHRPNRRAIHAGYILFAVSLALLLSGLILMRIDGLIEVRDPLTRNTAYWIHTLCPLIVVWLFIRHRLAGPPMRWKVGLGGAVMTSMVAAAMWGVHQWDHDAHHPQSIESRFLPSLARTANGDLIPARVLMNDQYCARCHGDSHEQWLHSMHHFSSFNNPAYRETVFETRQVMRRRDGHVRASRFCAGCHDPVPLFVGTFDDPIFDDHNNKLDSDPIAQAGITCTVCHAMTRVNSRRGNADYTIDEPAHYPFAYSDNDVLQWLNRALIKAKPAFHKNTFLKPLHKTPEFCSTCHKVHLPKALNQYKFLRGQNHYDSYHLSGVSGHGVTSFYYPDKAIHGCATCHMPTVRSTDFGARPLDESGILKIHDHQFPAANTAIPYLTGMPAWVHEKQRRFLEGAVRVDIFGLKEDASITGQLHAPIRPRVPTLAPGGRYLLEIVIRTLRLGHHFTQGTTDSNEVWLDVTVRSGDRIIGRSGGRNDEGRVDPWTHFVNAFVLDRHGNRIARRNAQDIFVALYDHQIPPGAADVVHYQLDLPDDLTAPIAIEIELQYRKFDTTYLRFFQGDRFIKNDLPVTTLATDRVIFPIAGRPNQVENEPSSTPTWQRWNDYGIGLFRKGGRGSGRGEWRQAEAAFKIVEQLGRAEGPLNRARVYIKEGRLANATRALHAAAQHEPPAESWSLAWFSGLVNKQYGHLDEAIENFRQLFEMDSPETRDRQFDFAQDYRLLNELGQVRYEQAKLEPSQNRQHQDLLRKAIAWFERTLELDPENVTAHFNLSLLYAHLENQDKASEHRRLHAAYKPDDNARDRAIAQARLKYPVANHAAESIVIWDLHREGAFELPVVP